MPNLIFNHQKSALAATISSLFIFPSLAMADNNSPDNIETMSIYGQTYRNTATKTALEPDETPQAINIVDSETLKARGVKSLNQALRYTPGVLTEQRGGSVTMYDTFNIRGFDVSQSYYDGLILQSLTGWNLQPQIDPIALQQVEVFKGPTSVLYGAMPPGGMVNMIAKSPQAQNSTDIGLATGSRQLVEASIDTTGQIGDSNFNYRFIGLARKQDGQVNHTKEERYVIAPSIDWNISDKTLVNFNLYYQNDPSMGMNSAMPASGMFVNNPNGSTNPNTFVGDTNWSKFEREFLLAGYKIQHEFNNQWTFLQNFRYMKADLTQENTYHREPGWDPTTGNLDRNIYDTKENSQGFTIDNQLSHTLAIANTDHNLLFGIDYQYLDGDSHYNEYGTTNQFGKFNIFNPNNNMIDRSKLSATYSAQDKIKTTQVGTYFQDQVRINNLVLIGGGRFDHFDYTSNYTDASGKTKSEADHSAFTYRVGGLYEFDNGIAPFASFATSFEPAASQQGVNYDPETAEQIEVGAKFMSSDMSTTGSISYFNIVKSDVLMANPSDPWGAQVQVGEVTSQGVEAQVQWFITDAFDVSASYTYTDIEITKDNNNNLEGTTPIYVPAHAANLWANYVVSNGMLGGLRTSAGVRYTGKMYADATNTQGKVPDHTLVDLSVGYDLSYVSDGLDGATANLIVNNLFDEEYYTCDGIDNCWYGQERTLEVNMNYKF